MNGCADLTMTWSSTSPNQGGEGGLSHGVEPVAIDHRLPVEIHDLGADRHLCGETTYGCRDLGHGDQRTNIED